MLDYHVHLISSPAISSAALLFFTLLFANEFRRRKLKKSAMRVTTLLIIPVAGLFAGAFVDFQEVSEANGNKEVLEQKGFQEWGGVDPVGTMSWQELSSLCRGEVRLTDSRYDVLSFDDVEGFSDPVRLFCRMQ